MGSKVEKMAWEKSFEKAEILIEADLMNVKERLLVACCTIFQPQLAPTNAHRRISHDRENAHFPLLLVIIVPVCIQNEASYCEGIYLSVSP